MFEMNSNEFIHSFPFEQTLGSFFLLVSSISPSSVRIGRLQVTFEEASSSSSLCLPFLECLELEKELKLSSFELQVSY